MAALSNMAGHYILPCDFYLLLLLWPPYVIGQAIYMFILWFRYLGTIPQLCRAVSSQLRHVSTIGKNVLSSDMSSTCPHNMVNFGLLTAEICWRVWGTPANFNGFRAGGVTARHSSIGRQPNFAALNRRRQLYSTGQPSRWVLGHILVEFRYDTSTTFKGKCNSCAPRFTT